MFPCSDATLTFRASRAHQLAQQHRGSLPSTVLLYFRYGLQLSAESSVHAEVSNDVYIFFPFVNALTKTVWSLIPQRAQAVREFHIYDAFRRPFRIHALQNSLGRISPLLREALFCGLLTSSYLFFIYCASPYRRYTQKKNRAGPCNVLRSLALKRSHLSFRPSLALIELALFTPVFSGLLLAPLEEKVNNKGARVI